MKLRGNRIITSRTSLIRELLQAEPDYGVNKDAEIDYNEIFARSESEYKLFKQIDKKYFFIYI